MDLSFSQAPQGMSTGTGNISLTPSVTGVQTTEVTQKPLVEQPVQDQISQYSGQQAQSQMTIAYTASPQIPVLQKPQEKSEKEDKKLSEKQTSSLDSQQEAPQIDSDHQVQKEGKEGEQGGGGADSGSQGGTDSGSHSFSGGDNPLEKLSVDSGVKLEQNTSVNKSAATATENLDNKANTVNTKVSFSSIDPLDEPTGVTSSGLFSPPINPAQFFDNAGKIMTELHALNVKFAETMPEGPEKMRFADFLKMVQSALMDFQQLLRELQMKDSKGAQDRTKARLETTLAKIEEQRKEQAEMAQKAEEAKAKAKIMGPLSTIFAFLLVILLSALLILFLPVLIFSGPGGWMAMGMIISELIDQSAKVVGQKPFLMEKFIEALTIVTNAMVDAAQDNSNMTADEAKKQKVIAKTVVISLTMALTFSAAPGLYIFGGATALLSFLNESHIIRDMQIQSGMDELDANKMEMYIGVAIGAAFAVAAFAAAFIIPPGAVAGVAGSVVNAVTSAAKTAAQFIVKMINILVTLTDQVAIKTTRIIQAIFKVLFNPETWVQATSLGLQTTNAVTTYKYQSILADIALIQGRLDSEVELKETTIQILKKMIKMLLDGLQGTAEDIAKIGQLLKKTHANVSDISSSLFG